MRSNPTYWDQVRKELKPKFARVGLLNTCELYDTKSKWRSPKCEKNKNLGFAHSLRRNDIDTFKKNGDLEGYEIKMRRVARLCGSCHGPIDANKRNVSEEIIEGIIKRRKRPVV